MRSNIGRQLTVSHWLPIVTFCPVNNLPDIIYVSVGFDSFVELYAVRRKIKMICSWRKDFMETICEDLLLHFPEATFAEVRLLTGRHIASCYRYEE